MTDKKVEIAAKLNDSRRQLMAFFEGLDEAGWETAVYHEETSWSITDILRHLVDSENGMTSMMMQWLQGNDPVPPDFDLERWNNRAIRKTAEKTPAQLLDTMRQNRINLLSFIDTLKNEDWERQGRHGSLRIMSIEQVCHLIAHHELDHLQVMQAAVGKN
ncbi:MAG: DinB family protein [Candidatus Promineifilaceae bacterium]|nr:DinB family protein [Anaerolineaceae bacterium]